MPVFHSVFENVFVGQDAKNLSNDKAFRYIHPAKHFHYNAYCDDFGPMNMSSTIGFIKLMDSELASFPDAKIVVCAEDGPRALTNAVFLVGAYMIIKLDMAPAQVSSCFNWLDPSSIESYRDATYSRPDFRLHLVDCWRGIHKGKELGWVRYGGAGYMWGQIDVEE